MTKLTNSRHKVELDSVDRARVDELCDAFEAEWRRLHPPQIEEYLTVGAPHQRAELLVELVRIDRFWRKRTAEKVHDVDEFAGQVPVDLSAHGRAQDVPENSSAPLISQQASLGPFHDLERIGEGAFGVVFRAWDSRHHRQVALKVPRFGFELVSDEMSRFLREAKSAGSLDHPGIARVWDSGMVSGVTYIASQFVQGGNLRDRFQEIAVRPPARIAGFVAQLAEAVHFAHDHGIVHRDIKPSNILLTQEDRPVLTDFGLALATAGDATRSLAALVGTLDYMSPEQARGDSPHVDGRSDLWSLGVLMYELLTGERPFGAASDVDLLRSIMQDEPKRLRSVRRDLPRDLEVLTMRCLQKRPIDRLASCGELADELGRVAHDEPIRSRPVSFVERSVRWCRRNPKPLATFSLTLLAMTLGAWSWGGWAADNRQNENLVQKLQIEIETKNAQRRELIEGWLRGENVPSALSPEDLQFVAEQLLRSDDPQLRDAAAALLQENEEAANPAATTSGS